MQQKSKIEKAAALEYNKERSGAPKVIAQGRGELARRIIQKAEEFDIPLFQNELLVDSLLDLDLDREIPASLYNAVVEVFVWLANSEKKASKR